VGVQVAGQLIGRGRREITSRASTKTEERIHSEEETSVLDDQKRPCLKE